MSGKVASSLGQHVMETVIKPHGKPRVALFGHQPQQIAFDRLAHRLTADPAGLTMVIRYR